MLSLLFKSNYYIRGNAPLQVCPRGDCSHPFGNGKTIGNAPYAFVFTEVPVGIISIIS